MLKLLTDTPKLNSPNYRPEIDGLRAVAVLMVVFFHLDGTGIFSGGFIGVDIFFVISGYLITGIIYNKKIKGDFNYINFISSRIGRLYPALIVTVISILLIGFLLYSNAYFSTTRETSFYSLVSISNIIFSSEKSYWDLDSTTNPLLHTWSLSVEQQFYLFWPFYIIIALSIFKKNIKYFILISFVIFLCYTSYSNASSTQLFYLTQYRSFEFLAGSIAFFYEKDSNRINKNAKELIIFLAISIILFCATNYNQETKYHPGVSTVPVLLSAIACILYGKNTFFGKIIRNKLFVFIGIISYSVYLVHWPVIVFYKYINNGIEISYLESFILIFITLTLGILLYKYVENKFRKINPLKNLLSLSILLSISLLTILSSKYLEKYKIDIIKPIGKYESWTRYCNNEPKIDTPPKYVWTCNIGAKEVKDKILILGDSHAAQLIPFFDYIGKKNKMSFYIISAPHCIPIEGFDIELSSFKDRCINAIEYTKKIEGKFNKLIFIGIWQDKHTNNNYFKNLLLSFIDNNKDKKIFFMSSVPKFESDPLIYRESILLSFFGKKMNYNHGNAYNSFKELLIEKENVDFIDLQDSKFFSKIPIYKGIPMYFDNSHLTADGSIEYAKDSDYEVIKHIKK
ncbi:acyltransferase family protein [Proteus mirabilis]|uniref:acyltransferase family protein n=1 Tax=Proteus mirabilis TaxID=584 RepID=UPI00227E3566|nr:acyltransferase family protein [Proteus mirabilis]MCY9778528.1 acyltransferase [Proteus mirabilis]MCY9781588.1 acyltransferase [Proteus mirabilis]MCY9790714.1 acyltransferase [Proteus mirabilis]